MPAPEPPPPDGPNAQANELIRLWTATLAEARDTNRRVDFLIRRLLAAGVITVEPGKGAPGGRMPQVHRAVRQAGSVMKELRKIFGRPE